MLSSIRIALTLFLGIGVGAIYELPLLTFLSSSWAQDTFQSKQICAEGAENISHQDIASARSIAKNKALQKAVELKDELDKEHGVRKVQNEN